MTDHYCDLGSLGAWNSRTGHDSSGNEYLGCSGFQQVLDHMTAGDVCYVKGTGDLTKCYSVIYDANSGSLTNGEAVSWDDGSGVVQFATFATPVLVEVTSGNPPSDNDVITGATSTSTITVAGTPAKIGQDCNTNAGSTTTGFIRVFGVNSSWTRDGTRAVLDGGGTLSDHIVYGVKSGWWWENLRFTNCGGTSSGFYNGLCEGNIFVNCCFDANYYGYSVTGTGENHYFFRCTFYGNHYGSAPEEGSKFFFCSFHDNDSFGTDSLTNLNCLFYHCLFFDNGGSGLSYVTATILISCVFDGNVTHGARSAGGSSYAAMGVVGCRFTNNATGIDGAADIFWTLGCYFEDNATANLADAALHYNVPLDGSETSSNDEDNGDTNEGYVSRTDGSENFNLRTDASLRRMSIAIPTS